MLNKKNRIGNRKVIEALFTKGKLHKSRFLIFKYEKAENYPSQFAIVVSKKVHKKANKRNHLRRQISEALRLNLPLLKKDIITVVIARPSAADMIYEDVRQSINTFFNTV